MMQPAGSSYDAVVSIEALIHSPSFEQTVRNLGAALKPSGKLVIVEDIPLDESRGDADLELMRRFWGLSEVPTASRYLAALTDNHFRILHDRNYSDGFQTASSSPDGRHTTAGPIHFCLSPVHASLPRRFWVAWRWSGSTRKIWCSTAYCCATRRS